MPSPLSFDTMRSWDGSQSRAFEELAYQLLKDTTPAGTRAIRTGNPDGGVEWYATLSDGTEVGWQAKHTHGIESLLSGMTASVERVVLERPRLRKLVFVISDNLSTSTQGGKRLSARIKYENKIESWRTSIAGAEQIEFDLIQGSDLLELLAKPAHRGRAWFWWDLQVFDDEWFNRKLRQQASAAGDKYRPELQIDLPIQNDLEALGFADESRRTLGRLLKAITDDVANLTMYPRGDTEQLAMYGRIVGTSSTLASVTDSVVLEAQDRGDALDELRRSATACHDAIRVAQEREFQNRRGKEQLERDDPLRESFGPDDIATGPSVVGLDNAIERLLDWLDGPVGTALVVPRYFLSGPAGSGKTHLFLDAVQRARAKGRPAVFLAGAQFGGNLWASVADQLGLPNLGADELLGGLDSVAEASALTGRRTVIFVDALNETSDSQFWTNHLPALRSAVTQWPHLALAVSCRDTYVEVVAESGERRHFLSQVHPGFSGKEDQAAAKYFAHYGLETPRFPLLTPEFSLPLFLRVYCEALQSMASPVFGLSGRTAIFEQYLNGKITTAARRLAPDASTGIELEAATRQVRKVIGALVDVLTSTGGEAVTVDDALTHTKAVLTSDDTHAARTLGVLQAEGVLTKERVYLAGAGRVDAVRIVFQAFSDYLVLRRRMDGLDNPLVNESFLEWLRDDASAGVLEAASVVLPEQFGQELIDVFDIHPEEVRRRYVNAEYSERLELRRDMRTIRSFFSTLPYRSAESVGQRSVDLLNEARRFISDRDLFHLMFVLAPQPEHRLNADKLHAHLIDIALPARDRYFGFATASEVLDPDSPAARLARWAAAGPYPDYNPDVIELAAIPLCWLFSSPHRYQRDWVTKSLSNLLRGHLDIATRLVRRFAAVNDPYVIQRVIVAAYGALLRATPASSAAAADLAQAVLDTVLAQPVRADEMLLDAARGIVLLTLGQGFLSEDAATRIRRPLGLAAPRNNPPSEKTLEAKYGDWENVPRDQSWWSIYGSIYGMGDFGRYVIEHAAHQFTSLRVDEPLPEITAPESRRPNMSAWRRFLQSLTEEQRVTIGEDAENSFPTAIRMNLTDEQHTFYAQVFPPPPRRNRDQRNARASVAKRWVFARAVSLGWTPQRFAERDSEIARWRHGREAHKAERWGKKYQWMALHEYVARMADNYRLKHDEPRYYRSRDIDPSLDPVPYTQFTAEPDADEPIASPWAPSPHRIANWPPAALDFRRYGGRIEDLVADVASEPSLAMLTRVTDLAGSEWVVLNGDLTQIDPRAVHEWRGLRQSATVTSWFVPRGTGRKLSSTLASASRFGMLDLTDDNGHSGCCYLRELGIVNTGCPHRQHGLNEHQIGDAPFTLVTSSERYSWTSTGLDCSIEESPVAIVPSTFATLNSSVTFNEAGPSWADQSGEIAYQYYWTEESSARALLVRASHLREFLAREDLELVVTAWFERMSLRRSTGKRIREPYVSATQVGWFNSPLQLREEPTRREVGDIEGD